MDHLPRVVALDPQYPAADSHTLGHDGVVTGRIRAWSRAQWWSLATLGPVGRAAQVAMARQHLLSLSG